MNESRHRRDTETQFKAIGDVENYQCPRNDECKYGVHDEFAADNRADFFLAKDFVAADIIANRRHNFLALNFFQINRANHYVRGGFNVGTFAAELNRRAVQAERFQTLADLSNGNGLFKFQIDNRAAREVNAEVEAARHHRDKTGDNHEQ